MFEQINAQSLAFGKNYADALLKAQGLALTGLESITRLNLSTFEDRLKASVEFWNEAASVRDFDTAREVWPKGVQLARESAEKLYANTQEVIGVSLKTSEALGNIAKGTVEDAVENVQAATREAAAAAPVASGKAAR